MALLLKSVLCVILQTRYYFYKDDVDRTHYNHGGAANSTVIFAPPTTSENEG